MWLLTEKWRFGPHVWLLWKEQGDSESENIFSGGYYQTGKQIRKFRYAFDQLFSSMKSEKGIWRESQNF